VGAGSTGDATGATESGAAAMVGSGSDADRNLGCVAWQPIASMNIDEMNNRRLARTSLKIITAPFRGIAALRPL
jgi:hypothetical protein